MTSSWYMIPGKYLISVFHTFQLIDSEAEWLTCMSVNWNFSEVYSLDFNWQWFIMGLDNGLSPVRHQAYILTHAGYKKMILKISSTKWPPFSLDPNVLLRPIKHSFQMKPLSCHGQEIALTCSKKIQNKSTISAFPLKCQNIGEKYHSWTFHRLVQRRRGT